MSVEAKKWVLQHPARTSAQQAVLEALAWASEGRGAGARISYRDIANKTRLHRNTVLRALRDLELDDRIVRHREHGEDCPRCSSARRKVAVYDVVIPAVPEEVAAGQMNLLATASKALAEASPTGTSKCQSGVPVETPDWHTPCATTGTPEVPQGSKGQEEEQQQRDAHANESTGHPLVEDTLRKLRGAGLFIDRFAIESVLVRYVDRPHLVEDALVEVVALAGDPAYRQPKGGAAMMLLRQIRQQANPPRRSYGNRPAPDAAAPNDFAKYDVGLVA